MSNWSHVGSASNAVGTGSTSVAVTTGWTVAVGDLLVVTLAQYNGSFSGLTLSDSGSNTWTHQADQKSSVPQYGSIWTSVVTTGGTLTVTLAATTAAFLTLDVEGFRLASGTPAAAESIVSATGDSTSASPGAITPTGTDLLVSAVIYSVAVSPAAAATVSSPWNLSSSQVYIAGKADLAFAYMLDQTSAQTPTFAIGGGSADYWSSIGLGIPVTLPSPTASPVAKWCPQIGWNRRHRIG